MNTYDLLNIALALTAVGLLLDGLLLFHRVLRPSSEAVRKIIHIGIGLIVLPFPWMFHQPIPVLVFALILAGMFAALRQSAYLRRHARELMNGTRRDSFGEFYFVMVVPLLFFLAGDHPLLFVVPMLLLTFADATAALVGRRYGLHPYRLTAGHKSLEGSTGFFITAFIACHIPLYLFTPIDRGETLTISLAIAALTTILEAISFAGLDNLLVPLAAIGVLWLGQYYTLTSAAGIAAILACAVLVASLTWRRTSIHDELPPPVLPTRGVTWRF